MTLNAHHCNMLAQQTQMPQQDYQPSPVHPDFANQLLSFYRGAYDPTPSRTLSLAQVLSTIASDTYAHQITCLRNTLQSQGEGIYSYLKKRLDGVTFGGTFAPTRAKDNLLQHSKLAHLDYDGLRDVAGVKRVLCGGVGVCYCFVSPSGCGLKLGMRVEPVDNDAEYKHAWQVVADHFAQQYGLIADPSGKDISRLCFLSWDPMCYFNPNAEVFPVPAIITPLPPAPISRATPLTTNRHANDRRWQYLQHAITRATTLIETSRPPTNGMPGTRHYNRLKAARLLGGYVGGGFCTHAQAYSILECIVRHNTMHFERSMKTIADGLRYGMKSPVTFEQLEHERLAWCAARGYISAKRSSN
jgi:VirE N-terminal domain